jgi:hypothetical protein
MAGQPRRWHGPAGPYHGGPEFGDGAAAVDGQSVVTNPLLLEAILKGWANAQAELLPAEGPCKIADYSDAPGRAEGRAGRSAAARHELLPHHHGDRVRPETSHMLLWGCYFGGSASRRSTPTR